MMTDVLDRICLVVCLLLFAGSAQAQETEPSDARLEAMVRRTGLLKMSLPEDEKRPAPELSKSSVLRCNDPTREEVDGTVWLWLEGKRPLAALCLFLVREQWNYEHVSLCDEALKVTGRPDWAWQPPATKRAWLTLDEPVPGSTAARDRTSRALAGRFTASEVRKGEPYPLRLLPRPLYTYADPERGIVHGALFAFVYGTNPEILVQLEAREAKGKPAWNVSFARLSSAEISVKLGEKEVWTVPAMTASNPKHDYFSAHGKDPID
jgi:hypothetical protein